MRLVKLLCDVFSYRQYLINLKGKGVASVYVDDGEVCRMDVEKKLKLVNEERRRILQGW